MDLGDAISSGDYQFLFNNVHPAVIERYGTRQCRNYTRTTQIQGLELEFLAETGPAPWDWELDGVTTPIPDAHLVTINWHDPSVDEPREIHIAPADGTWRWFTDCGDPIV